MSPSGQTNQDGPRRVRFRSTTDVAGVASDQFSAKGAISVTICRALAFLQGRISQGWDKSKCPCNCGIGIAVKRSLPRSPKLHTKRQRQRSILHFLDVLASGNSYRAMRPHGTDACGLCFQSVHQLGFRYAWFDASASNVWPSSAIRVCHGSSLAFCLSLLKTSPTAATVISAQ